jgi:microsomal dipeptidase-like Zn-dependent dipeptidase
MKPDDELRAVVATSGVIGISVAPHTTLSPETPGGKSLTCDPTGGLEGERLADLLVLLAAWPDLHTNQETKRSPGLAP